MSVLIAEQIEKSWGDRHVLRGCNIRVSQRDRAALVGNNGSGKSTLLKILAGIHEPDTGEVKLRGTIAVLHQRPELSGETVADAAAASVAWHATLLHDYEAALVDGNNNLAADLQDQLDHRGWTVEHQVSSVLGKVGAPPMDAKLASLSGGELRRVALATVLLQQPDVLLLDEPTNHLDADAVEWLQAFLIGYRGAVLLVTHDRYLLEAVAERIVEVNEGLCDNYQGSYADYLIQRAERRARLSVKRDRHLRMITQEAAWASRSPSARSTKQKARLQRLDTLRENVPQVTDRTFNFSFTSGIHAGTTLLQIRDLTKSFGDRTLFDGVNFEVRPKERLAILGRNGTGKSTLLKLIQNMYPPDRGSIDKYSRATIGVLDQARTGLNNTDTVLDAAGDGKRIVTIGDQDVAVQTFLGLFAFPRQMFEQKVSSLSGGEHARLLLAKLMLCGHQILLLDEPTNDLDLLTLRVLEEALLGFDGAVIIVSHDRAFVDRVATAVLSFDEDGQVVQYASRIQANAARDRARKAIAEVTTKTVSKPKGKAKKSQSRLSFKERSELGGLPALLEEKERIRAEKEAELGHPNTYKNRSNEIPALTAELESLVSQVQALYARWEDLEERA
ncbi:MAG: ATP-binding cassette domain-containing protein [Rhodobacterales bacterium]|nr:ATP-binding cassette domain-containing protein [Rhodobacterales bacterium]